MRKSPAGEVQFSVEHEHRNFVPRRNGRFAPLLFGLPKLLLPGSTFSEGSVTWISSPIILPARTKGESKRSSNERGNGEDL